MKSKPDILIDRLLKASLICWITYNVLYLLLYLFMQPIFNVLNPVIWHYAPFGSSDEAEIVLKPFFGTVIYNLFNFAIVFGLWVFISTMTDMSKFSSAGGILLVVYKVIMPIISSFVSANEIKFTSISGTTVSVNEIKFTSSSGTTSLAARSLYLRLISYSGFIGTAAVIILFMAFAMLWYKHTSLSENTI